VQYKIKDTVLVSGPCAPRYGQIGVVAGIDTILDIVIVQFGKNQRLQNTEEYNLFELTIVQPAQEQLMLFG